jgi:hypothetical protein
MARAQNNTPHASAIMNARHSFFDGNEINSIGDQATNHRPKTSLNKTVLIISFSF